jgi:hypothetical protein
MAAARRRVAHLEAMSRATDAAEAKIAEAAEKRLAEVDAEIAKARPRAMLHDGAAEHLETLTTERGHLQRVIAQAQARMGPEA